MPMRSLLAATAVVVVLGATAPITSARSSRLTNCGTVTGRGWSFHVAEFALPSCAAARGLTKRLLGLGFPKGTALRRYPGTYLGMGCFAAVKVGAGAQIQCTSADGKKTLLAVARP